MRIMFIKRYYLIEDDAEVMIEFGDEATLLDISTNEIMLDDGYIFSVSPSFFLPLCEEEELACS